MCRLLGYLGQPVSLETYLIHPKHSLVAQSYQPKEMTAGLLNADGFGMGWYGTSPHPHRYRNTLPIWNDPNVEELSRYITSGNFLAYIRSATIGQSLQLSNCQPFRDQQILGIHNGFIDNFRQTLYRPMHECLSDDRYQTIEGTTDSEHILALVFETFAQNLQMTLFEALAQTLHRIKAWATSYNVRVSLNVILSDGLSMLASRFAYPDSPPSLYWLGVHSPVSGVLVVSEPLDADEQMRSQFGDRWQVIPANSLLTVDANQTVEIHAL